jgi:hypothetical protein
MSVESMQALPCPGCGIRIYWVPYHVPHCPNHFNSAVVQKMKEGKFVARN